MAGLRANLAVFVGTPLLVNGVIFGFGLESSSGQTGLPPGWVVGTIWLLLFAGDGRGAVDVASSSAHAWRTEGGGVG